MITNLSCWDIMPRTHRIAHMRLGADGVLALPPSPPPSLYLSPQDYWRISHLVFLKDQYDIPRNNLLLWSYPILDHHSMRGAYCQTLLGLLG